MSVTLLCLVLWMFEESIYNKISGANSCEDPPVPIPNTEVKLTNAENTWLVTTRENRTVPEFSAVKSFLTADLLIILRAISSVG